MGMARIVFENIFLRGFAIYFRAQCTQGDKGTMLVWRGPALSMHIVNYPSSCAPILCKQTCIVVMQVPFAGSLHFSTQDSKGTCINIASLEHDLVRVNETLASFLFFAQIMLDLLDSNILLVIAFRLQSSTAHYRIKAIDRNRFSPTFDVFFSIFSWSKILFCTM